MTPQQRRKYGLKYGRNATQAEAEALARWLTDSHPSNHPKDAAQALWSFPTAKDGTINARLFCGLRIVRV